MPVYSSAYSIPYLLFMSYLVILVFLEFRYLKLGKDTKYLQWATIGGMIFFFGLRGFIYTDWMVYYPTFEKVPTIWDGGLISAFKTDFTDQFITDVNVGKSGIEIGFIYFTVLLKSIFPNYFVWVFVNTVIDIFLLDIFFRRYAKYYVFGFLIFFVFGGQTIEGNLMRNVKSIVLFLISLKYLEERRLLPYIMLNLLGVAFHSTAIIFLPLYFVLQKKWPKWLMWTIFVIGNLLFLLHIKYLGPTMLSMADLIGGRLSVQIKLYFASDFYNQPYGISLGYIERIITFIVITILQNRLIEQNKHISMFINAYVLYFISFFFFSEIMVAVDRLTLLFIFSYWILYPEILSLIKQVANKIIIVTTMIIYCALKLVIFDSSIFSKYDNLLFGIESYEERCDVFYTNMDTIMNNP